MASEVVPIIDSSRDFASDWVAQVNNLLAGMKTLSQQQITVTIPPTNNNGPLYSIEAAAKIKEFGEATKKPADLAARLNDMLAVLIPDLEATPLFDTSKVTTVVAPVATFSKVAPILNIPNSPSGFLPTAPGAAPDFISPALPDAPLLAFPLTPTLTAFTLPDAPSIEFPVFDRASPYYDVAPPTASFDFADAPYESALLDALKVKLLNDLANGGYGIDPADEAGLWERASEREAGEGERAIEEAERTFASRGFMVPPGALFSAMEGVRAKVQQSINSLSREVALKRADLYVQNRQFTIGQVKELEGTLINMHMGTMERLLNAAKYTAQFVLDLYQARVRELEIKLEGWKAEAQVFGERVRAEVSKAEVYRVQLEAVRVITDADRARVDMYRAQLSGVESMVALYRSRLEAARVQSEMERIKLEAFKYEVDAYTAGVQAKAAEFGMYEARIRGEVAKVQSFSEEVKAHNMLLEGARIQLDTKKTELDMAVETANGKQREYELRLKDSEVRIKRIIDEADLSKSLYGIDADVYKTNIAAIAEAVKMKQEETKMNTEVFRIFSDVNIKGAQFNLEKLKAQYDLQEKAGVAGAEVYGKMVTGAMSAITAIASISE